jgi:hypothetical protein
LTHQRHLPTVVLSGFKFRCLFCLILCLLAVQRAVAQNGKWKELPFPVSPGQPFSRIDFADSVNGWLLSADGYFTRSTDGGNSWSVASKFPHPGKPREFKLYNERNAVVLMADSMMYGYSKPRAFLITTDGGAKWSSAEFPDTSASAWVGSVSLLRQDRIGFIKTTYDGQYFYSLLYTSSNLGISWDTVTTFYWLANCFGILKNGRMFACPLLQGPPGPCSVDYSDDGIHWNGFIPDAHYLWLVGSWGEYFNDNLCCFNLTYEDGSLGFRILYNATTGASSEIGGWGTGALYDDGSVLSISYPGGLVSDSAGLYDITQSEPHPALPVAQLATLSSRSAWILTSGGRLFKRIDKDTGVEDRTRGLVTALSLEQNYPNPFNPSTVIRYSLNHSGEATLRVFDILGHLVATLHEGSQSSGDYVVEWDASGLPSGLYFYRLESTSSVLVRKALLLK